MEILASQLSAFRSHFLYSRPYRLVLFWFIAWFVPSFTVYYPTFKNFDVLSSLPLQQITMCEISLSFAVSLIVRQFPSNGYGMYETKGYTFVVGVTTYATYCFFPTILPGYKSWGSLPSSFSLTPAVMLILVFTVFLALFYFNMVCAGVALHLFVMSFLSLVRDHLPSL